MKYFLIAGEASGDLHAAHLMRALQQLDAQAQFRYYGGDEMQAVGGELLCHYRHLAYMGFVQVALHLRTILRGMRACKEAIRTWQPDLVILVDYPGFNLSIAKAVKRAGICPVCYYISPKIWAWKEHRIQAIRRDVDLLLSILPFEPRYFAERHHYEARYVGNPTLDEVHAYLQLHGAPQPDGHTLALLPGSRRQEVVQNLPRMLAAVSTLPALRPAIAVAPALPRQLYHDIIARSPLSADRVTLVEGGAYGLLHHAQAALVTSGTATLETALFGVPQVVCYRMEPAHLAAWLRPYFLKVPYISLVNLILSAPALTELVGAEMNPEAVRAHLLRVLPSGEGHAALLAHYAQLREQLGEPGAPLHAAQCIQQLLKKG